MNPCGNSQGLQIAGIRGQDEVSIRSEEHDCRVDDVGLSSTTEQSPCSFTQILIERENLEPRQKASQRGLAARPAPPDLTHHAAMGPWNAAVQDLAFEEGDRIPIPAFHRQQRARIEHDGQRRPRRRAPLDVDGAAPRALSARALARRAAERISSAVISP